MKAWRMLGVLVAASLVLTVGGCGGGDEPVTTATSATAASQTPATADEYDVYSALIQSVYIDPIQPKRIVIRGGTVKPVFSQAISVMKSSWPGVDDDIVGDFKAKNQTSTTLERTFVLSVPYTLMSEQEVASIFASSATGWGKFHAKYPDAKGWLALSRVGFNPAKDTAVLYTEYQSTSTAGEGDVVLMKKTDGRWSVQGTSMFWQS